MKGSDVRQKVFIWVICSVMVSILASAGGAVAARAGDPTRKIVVFKRETPRQAHHDVVERHGGRMLRDFQLVKGAAMQLPAVGTQQALQALQNDPDVEAVYDDQAIQADNISTTNSEWRGLFADDGGDRPFWCHYLLLCHSETA